MKTKLIASVAVLVALTGILAFASPGKKETKLGCAVTIKCENKSLKNLKIDLSESQVRIKEVIAMPWSKLSGKCALSELLVAPKATNASVACTMDFGCSVQRQWKFKLVEFNPATGAILNTYWQYYPSSSTWSNATTVSLGNIGRFF